MQSLAIPGHEAERWKIQFQLEGLRARRRCLLLQLEDKAMQPYRAGLEVCLEHIARQMLELLRERHLIDPTSPAPATVPTTCTANGTMPNGAPARRPAWINRRF